MQKVTPTITKPQIQKLHCIYRELNIDSKEFINMYTHGRTDSTAGLTKEEATGMISAFTPMGEKAQRLRQMIYSQAIRCGVIVEVPDNRRAPSAVRLDMFLKQFGAVKKALNKMSYEELKTTNRQMSAIARGAEKNKDNKEAQQATDQLLRELNIMVAE